MVGEEKKNTSIKPMYLFVCFLKDCTWYRKLTIKFDYFWHIVDYQFTGIIIASILKEAARLQLVCNQGRSQNLKLGGAALLLVVCSDFGFLLRCYLVA